MSIKYNGKLIAGKYKAQIIPSADTVNEGKIKIATQLEVDEGTSNNSAVTPLYLSKKQDKLTAGTGIEITEDNVINNTQTSAEWGNIQGDIVNQSDLISEFGKKQDVITDIDTIRSNAGNAANNSLSNLSEAGQAIVDYKANIDLNNLSETGEARFNGKANVNLDNLTEAGEKHFLNKSQITNCLLEVPQRIKYTLENGILTIKAGSVVIVPYGTEDLSSTYPVGSIFLNENFKVYDTQFVDSKFFVWIELQNDTTVTCGNPNDRIIFIGRDGTVVDSLSTLVTSGPTTDSTRTNMHWYDTSENIIKEYLDGSWQTSIHVSLPIITATANSDKLYTSVNNVFNGFGYIGSTVWVDKGVKGLIPDGRNEDGSLKNVEITTNKIILRNFNTYTLNEHRTLFFVSDYKLSDSINFISGSLADRPVTLSTTKATMYLCEDENIMYYTSGSTTANWTVYKAMSVGDFNVTSEGKIASFNLKQPFRAVDYSDKSNISGWSLPSTKYIDLTLGARGASYTAPANGWVQCGCIGTAGSTYFELVSDYVSACASYNGGWGRACIPVFKGMTFYTYYGGTNFTSKIFRFTYAQGEVS